MVKEGLAFLFALLLMFPIGIVVLFFRMKISIFLSRPLWYDITARVLKSEVEKPFFSIDIVMKGRYKGREVRLKSRGDPAGDWYEIMPRFFPSSLSKERFFIMHYPKPTKETDLRGKKVCYAFPARDVKTEQDVINILEKLTEAAEIVEQNKPYYLP